MVEAVGLEIINEGRWKEVLLVHENATGTVASTSKYCLILGIAYYYNGQLFDALAYLKRAKKLEDGLPEYLNDYLAYYFFTAQYLIGLINDKEYRDEIYFLEKNSNIGLYINLENAKSEYYESKEDPEIKHNKFLENVNRIIENPEASDNIKLLCKCEILLHQGYKNNIDLVRNISMINALESTMGAIIQLRIESAKKLIENKDEWYKYSQKLKEEAFEKKNYFIYYSALINEVKVIYQFETFTDYTYVTIEIPDAPSTEKPDRSELFQQLLEKVEASYTFFKSIGHTENIIASLSIKYTPLDILKN